MNYKEHYNQLIVRAKNRTLDCYTEKHHIIPKCMNGTDDKSNLVELTAREHFIAHILLVKIYPKSYGLIKSMYMMCVHQTKERSMNRTYGWLREKFSEAQSIGQSGERNSQYGTRWIHNLNSKENKRLKRFETLEDGWLFGKYKEPKQPRIKIKKQPKPKPKPKVVKKPLNIEKIKILTEYYSIYSKVGFKKFVEITDYKFSQVNLVRQLNKFVKEFIPQNGKKRGK